MATEVIYTDGACSGNGTENSVGGFGIFIAKSTLASHPLKINRKGEHMTVSIGDGLPVQTYHVTNIRMEGLAIVATLALYADIHVLRPSDLNRDPIYRLNNRNPFTIEGFKVVYGSGELNMNVHPRDITIEIVTDSKFWINVIEDWMPKWVKKGIVLDKANPDILLMFRYYLALLDQNGIKVKFTHVRSHQKGKRTEHADGNDVADVLATSAAKNATSDFYMQ